MVTAVRSRCQVDGLLKCLVHLMHPADLPKILVGAGIFPSQVEVAVRADHGIEIWARVVDIHLYQVADSHSDLEGSHLAQVVPEAFRLALGHD